MTAETNGKRAVLQAVFGDVREFTAPGFLSKFYEGDCPDCAAIIATTLRSDGEVFAKCQRNFERPHPQLQALLASANTPEAVAARRALVSKFRILSDVELDELPDPEWDVTGVLPSGGLVTIIGFWESFKTFLALWLAFCIAAGIDWCGRAVRQCAVLYVITEGSYGARKRVRALKRHYGITGSVPLYVLPEAVNLVSDTDPGALMEAIRAKIGGGRVVVFFDTLIRSMAGAEENSSKDMSLVIAAAARLQREIPATVVVVHHTGWSGEHSRGSSALPGAVDVEITVTREEDTPNVTVKNTKMKDGPHFPEMSFTLTPVPEADSMVLVQTTATTPTGVLPGRAVKLLRALKQITRIDRSAIPEADWKTAAGFGRRGMMKSTYLAARAELINHQCVQEGEGEYANHWWITSVGNQALGRLDRPERFGPAFGRPPGTGAENGS